MIGKREWKSLGALDSQAGISCSTPNTKRCCCNLIECLTGAVGQSIGFRKHRLVFYPGYAELPAWTTARLFRCTARHSDSANRAFLISGIIIIFPVPMPYRIQFWPFVLGTSFLISQGCIVHTLSPAEISQDMPFNTRSRPSLYLVE